MWSYGDPLYMFPRAEATKICKCCGLGANIYYYVLVSSIQELITFSISLLSLVLTFRRNSASGLASGLVASTSILFPGSLSLWFLPLYSAEEVTCICYALYEYILCYSLLNFDYCNLVYCAGVYSRPKA